MIQPDWLHKPALPTEKTFDCFVKNFGGEKIADFLPGNPPFQNADYLFRSENVIAELKTLQTDFGTTDSFRDKHIELIKKYISDGRMTFGSIFRSAERPKEYVKDLLRLFRPALSRILKKANTQIKDTKRELDLPHTPGILLLVNDDFLSLEPQFITSIISEILIHSYSSIDAFVYLTLNHYVDIPGNDYANLLWVPVYSEKAPNSLVDFINRLGNQWGQFLETEIGEFDNKLVTDNPATISQAKAILRQPTES
jgi:polyhydroxyalkanoate synthesis regulator phasin